jgi:hypothetical protein
MELISGTRRAEEIRNSLREKNRQEGIQPHLAVRYYCFGYCCYLEAILKPEARLKSELSTHIGLFWSAATSQDFSLFFFL